MWYIATLDNGKFLQCVFCGMNVFTSRREIGNWVEFTCPEGHLMSIPRFRITGERTIDKGLRGRYN